MLWTRFRRSFLSLRWKLVLIYSRGRALLLILKVEKKYRSPFSFTRKWIFNSLGSSTPVSRQKPPCSKCVRPIMICCEVMRNAIRRNNLKSRLIYFHFFFQTRDCKRWSRNRLGFGSEAVTRQWKKQVWRVLLFQKGTERETALPSSDTKGVFHPSF